MLYTKIEKFMACFFVLFIVCLSFYACAAPSQTVHEPLTIITAHKDYTQFEKAFKKAYPEVNLQFISYYGHNSTSYLHKVLETEIGRAHV